MLYIHKVNKNVIFYLHCLFGVDLLLCVALVYFYSDFFYIGICQNEIRL